MRVLILRPEPGNAATADAVAAMGLVPATVPLFEVVPLAWQAADPDLYDAVVMTSANAARFGGAMLTRYTHLPLIAVGKATAAAARDAGFGSVTAGCGNAEDLAPYLAGKRVLHLAGEDHRPVAGVAAAAVVYAARPRDLSGAEIGELDAPLALVHSPRAGARLAELISDRVTTTIVAISASAAAACGSGWSAVAVAGVPHDTAMLDVLAHLCKAPRVTGQAETS